MNVNEIFASVNGEVCAMYQGSLCTFIRLQGCNLKCSYCDTPQAQGNKGKRMSVDTVFETVQNLGNKNVTITGGEPLLQLDDLTRLCLKLVNNGNRVSVETNGSVKLPEDISTDPHYEVWKYVNLVVDYKLPSSEIEDKMFIDNFVNFDYASNDFIKFVVGDANDFRKAKSVIRRCKSEYVKFAMSSVSGKLTPEELLSWMMKEECLKQRGVILNLQLHKILNVK